MPPLNSADQLLVASWLSVADLDLRVAERMHADDAEFYGYHIAFCCQQAVEKYAKAVLIGYALPARKTHDLPALLQQLGAVSAFSAAELDAADKLADYAVDIRYPPNHKLEPDELREALLIARHFCAVLRPLATALIS